MILLEAKSHHFGAQKAHGQDLALALVKRAFLQGNELYPLSLLFWLNIIINSHRVPIIVDLPIIGWFPIFILLTIIIGYTSPLILLFLLMLSPIIHLATFWFVAFSLIPIDIPVRSIPSMNINDIPYKYRLIFPSLNIHH